MTAAAPGLDPHRVRLALSFAAYGSDTVRMASSSLRGFSHLAASRQGIFAVNESGYSTIAHGFFFGITLRHGAIYLFEACDDPHSPTGMGRIVRIETCDDEITDVRVVAKGLDNGCHQIDFIAGRLCVVDTYNQQIVRFSADLQSREILAPFAVKATGRWEKTDPEYLHLNSLLGFQDKVLLLLHNGAQHTGRDSELAVCDSDWKLLERYPLEGSGCHGLAVLEDGSVLTCGSMKGELISADGLHISVSTDMTRGLAVGADSIAVGSSVLARRADRLDVRGSVTFFDRSYKRRSMVELPGGATEVRRLDGQDESLSTYLHEIGRDVSLKVGSVLV